MKAKQIFFFFSQILLPCVKRKQANTKAMAPRPSTSKQTIKPMAKPKPAGKRQRPSASDDLPLPAVDSLGLGKAPLRFAEESDEEEDRGIDADDDEDEDDGDEPFPEVDLGSSGSEGEDEEEEEGDTDEYEAAMLAELEAEDGALSSGEDDKDLSDLDELIARNTTKPDESEATPGTSWEDEDLPKDFMKRSKLVKSAITGQDKTEWEGGIDAGYGSDSSTEEVTWLSKVFEELGLIFWDL